MRCVSEMDCCPDRRLMVSFLCRFSGDIIHFDPHQLVRVLPARGRDHPADLPRRPPPREVPHIRHDTGLNKVSEMNLE